MVVLFAALVAPFLQSCTEDKKANESHETKGLNPAAQAPDDIGKRWKQLEASLVKDATGGKDWVGKEIVLCGNVVVANEKRASNELNTVKIAMPPMTVYGGSGGIVLSIESLTLGPKDDEWGDWLNVPVGSLVFFKTKLTASTLDPRGGIVTIMTFPGSDAKAWITTEGAKRLSDPTTH